MLHNKTLDSLSSTETKDANAVTVHTSPDNNTPPSPSSPTLSGYSGIDTPNNTPLFKPEIPPLDPLDLLTLDEVVDVPYDENTWEIYKDPAATGHSYVHRSLLKQGIVVISNDPQLDLSEMKFPYGNREFSIVPLRTTETDLDPNYKIKAASSARIIAQLNLFTQGNLVDAEAVKAALKETPLGLNSTDTSSPAIDIIADYYTHELCSNKDLGVVVTKVKKRKNGEIFFPFNFTDTHKSTQTGLYIHPSLPTSMTPEEKDRFLKGFKGFTDFFTGSGLLGSALQGFDQYDNRISLITPNLKIHPDQLITEIHYEPRLQLHETIQIQELTKLISLASQLAKEEKSNPANFYYHLPGYDYLLIGAELYLKGNMTKDAFNSFCYTVLNRHASLAKHIEAIGRLYGFPITIVNPFQLFFGTLEINFLEGSPEGEAKKALLGEKILNILQISSVEEHTPEQRIRDEVFVVLNCIDKLKNGPDNTLATVWKDFSEHSSKPVQTLKELGHIGNTVMMGAIAYKKTPYSVCIFRPVSEEFIFVQHERYAEHNEAKQNDAAWKEKYPPVQNCTVMDTAHLHSTRAGRNNGQSFYCLRAVGNLFKRKEIFGKPSRLLEQAGQNVAQCALSPPYPKISR